MLEKINIVNFISTYDPMLDINWRTTFDINLGIINFSKEKYVGYQLENYKFLKESGSNGKSIESLQSQPSGEHSYCNVPPFAPESMQRTPPGSKTDIHKLEGDVPKRANPQQSPENILKNDANWGISDNACKSLETVPGIMSLNTCESPSSLEISPILSDDDLKELFEESADYLSVFNSLSPANYAELYENQPQSPPVVFPLGGDIFMNACSDSAKEAPAVLDLISKDPKISVKPKKIKKNTGICYPNPTADVSSIDLLSTDKGGVCKLARGADLIPLISTGSGHSSATIPSTSLKATVVAPKKASAALDLISKDPKKSKKPKKIKKNTEIYYPNPTADVFSIDLFSTDKGGVCKLARGADLIPLISTGSADSSATIPSTSLKATVAAPKEASVVLDLISKDPKKSKKPKKVKKNTEIYYPKPTADVSSIDLFSTDKGGVCKLARGADLIPLISTGSADSSKTIPSTSLTATVAAPLVLPKKAFSLEHSFEKFLLGLDGMKKKLLKKKKEQKMLKKLKDDISKNKERIDCPEKIVDKNDKKHKERIKENLQCDEGQLKDHKSKNIERIDCPKKIVGKNDKKHKEKTKENWQCPEDQLKPDKSKNKKRIDCPEKIVGNNGKKHKEKIKENLQCDEDQLKDHKSKNKERIDCPKKIVDKSDKKHKEKIKENLQCDEDQLKDHKSKNKERIDCPKKIVGKNDKIHEEKIKENLQCNEDQLKQVKSKNKERSDCPEKFVGKNDKKHKEKIKENLQCDEDQQMLNKDLLKKPKKEKKKKYKQQHTDATGQTEIVSAVGNPFPNLTSPSRSTPLLVPKLIIRFDKTGFASIAHDKKRELSPELERFSPPVTRAQKQKFWFSETVTSSLNCGNNSNSTLDSLPDNSVHAVIPPVSSTAHSVVPPPSAWSTGGTLSASSVLLPQQLLQSSKAQEHLDGVLLANTIGSAARPLPSAERHSPVPLISETSRPSSFIDANGKRVWICPACGKVDNGSAMIGCDGGCEAWYHWICVGISVAPKENEDWFCRVCITRKKGIHASDKKRKRNKKK